jgi:hypothetical protein
VSLRPRRRLNRTTTRDDGPGWGCGAGGSLSPEPRTHDPAGASRFAPGPGPYLLDGIRGALNANVGGQGISVSFAGGR